MADYLLLENGDNLLQENGDEFLLESSPADSVTGTSATTNAADTSTAAGTTTILGTSATTNAADTSSAAGTTTVLGTSATTNANDASTAAGTTTVLGASATTNANDVSTASGTAGTAVPQADPGTHTGGRPKPRQYEAPQRPRQLPIILPTITGTAYLVNINDACQANGEVDPFGLLDDELDFLDYLAQLAPA